MIDNIEDAIRACKNSIQLHGQLVELNIDFNDRGDSVVVKYKGVVTLWGDYGTWLNFYGTISNNSPLFESIVNELKCLNAYIKTTSTNGEIDSSVHSDCGSFVYLRGSIISSKSIKVEYIACGENNGDDYEGVLCGIITDLDTKHHDVTLLIIDSYYHRYVTLPYEGDVTIMPNHIQNFDITLKTIMEGYTDMSKWIYCCNIDESSDITTQIVSNDIIEQAKLEHEIYENSINA